jgi:glucose 1-dehydrogenase
MKAIVIKPGKGDIQLIDIPELQIEKENQVKVKVLQVGICGTDREEVSGGRADPPPGTDRLVIGHEMFGKVTETAGDVTSVKPGDYVMVTVRRGCGLCTPCNNFRPDMCLTGKYKERGIKELDGFQSEYVVDNEKYIIKVPQKIKSIGVLTEPMSIVEKAIHESVLIQTSRMKGFHNDILKNKKAIIGGLGSVGLLASFLLRLNGCDVYGLDIVDENSARPAILKSIGGKYIDGRNVKIRDIDDLYGEADFIFEATGAALLEFQLIDALAINGIYVLTGIPSGKKMINIDGGTLITQMVLKNQVLLGSVNAAPIHYKYAVNDLVKIHRKWKNEIEKMITHKYSYNDYQQAFQKHLPGQIKAITNWDN